MIKAIIFDLDGVLVNATELHYEALNKALGLFGYEINKEEHFSTYNGLPTSEKLKILSERQGLPPELHEIIKRMKKIYTEEKIDQFCRPSYDKQLMLSSLKKKGFRLACCSNAQKNSVLRMLQKTQLDHYFELVIGNDEGFKPKPDPDIYLAAFSKMGISPSEALIIEDAAYGVMAAKASGGNVLAVKGFEEVSMSLFERYDFSSSLKKYHLDEFIKGWIIGNFDPTLFKTEQFEVAVKYYQKGDFDKLHYHKIAKEFTVIMSGVFKMNSRVVQGKEVVLIEPNQKTDFECLEDGVTLVIKIPSVKEDKYVCEEESKQ